MSHPIDSVVVDSVRVPKGDFRAFIGGQSLTLESADDIEGMTLGTYNTLQVNHGGITYWYDQADDSSSHDGTFVLVSADGRRYKPASALPLMEGAQNVVVRKVFDPLYLQTGFRRVISPDGVPYVSTTSYENSVGDHLRFWLETSVDSWDDEPEFALETNPLPEQVEIAYIGGITFIFVPCLGAPGGGYDGTLKFYWWKPGWAEPQEHPQSIAGEIPVWGITGVKWRYDGSSHRIALAHQVSNTVNRLNPSEVFDNCFAQRFSTYLWNSGTEEFDFEDNCDGTWGNVEVDILKTSKLGVTGELLAVEGAYQHDFGIDYTDEVAHPDWRDNVKFYNPPARITAYGSGGFNFSNPRTWTIERLPAGCGAVRMWEDDDGVTVLFTGQRANDGNENGNGRLHFLAEMPFYDVKADLTTEVIDSIKTGNSYNMFEGTIAGRKLIAIANSNSGGTPTSWFDLGWIDVLEWDTKRRRKRHITRINAPGASGIDMWEESGRVMIGWTETAQPVRTGAPTRAEHTASAKIAEIMALAFIGPAGDPLDTADGSIPLAKLETSGNSGNFIAGNGSERALDEDVEDIVGAMATDSSEVDFTYDDTAGTLTAALKNNSVAVARLAGSGSSSNLLRGDGWAANNTVVRAALIADEGTFTPVLEGVTTPGTHTYSAVTRGFYQRRGSYVKIQGYLSLSARDVSGGAMAGQLRLTGLPFTVLNDGNILQHSSILRPPASLNLLANYTFAILYFVPNTTTALFYQMGGNDTGAGSNMAGLDAATATGLIAFNFDAEYRIQT